MTHVTTGTLLTVPGRSNNRSTYTDTISVLVGPKQDRFTVHKDIICNHSIFFQTACSATWKEGQTGIVTLSHVEPYHFKIYVEHLYNESADLSDLATGLVNTQGLDSVGQKKAATTEEAALRLLCELWVLGDFLGDKSFNNDVMDRIPVMMEDYIKAKTETGAGNFADTAAYIIASAPVGSALNEWLVELTVLRITPDNIEVLRGHCPDTFVIEVFKAYAVWVAEKYQ